MLSLVNKIINPPVNLILRSPVHALLSKNIMLLTFTGRKSGRQYTTPVMYTRNNDSIIVAVAEPEEKQWWRNFKKPQQASITIGNQQLTAMGQAVTDDNIERLEGLYQHIAAAHPKLAKLANYAPGKASGCVAVEFINVSDV